MTDLVLQPEKEMKILRQIKQLMAEGNHQQAMNRLEDYSQQNPSESAEWYYRLGNLFYDAHAPERAKQAWEKSVVLRKVSSSLQPALPNFRSVLWKTVGLTILTVFSIYCLIVLLFPRQFDLMEMLMMSMQQAQMGEEQQEELSFWQKFWMTNRPSERQNALERDELWSVLDQHLKELMELFSSKEVPGSPEDQFVEWLNRYRYQQILNRPLPGKAGYYQLVGRGFFNLRQYTKAIEVLKNGLKETIDPHVRGVLYQEIATIYYYQGYQLQPDGLAKYDLNMVRKSVEAYQYAQQYIEDPYLYGNLGWGYYLLDDYERAVFYGEKALQLNKDLSYVRMNMGITYLRMHNYRKAFESYQGLLQLAPHSIDYIGGLRDLEELSRDFPGQYPFVHFIIGYIYYHQENFLRARQAWKVFLNQPFPDQSWKQKTQQMLSNVKNGRVRS